MGSPGGDGLHGKSKAEDWDGGGNRDGQGALSVRGAGPMGAGTRAEADFGLNGVEEEYEEPAKPVSR